MGDKDTDVGFACFYKRQSEPRVRKIFRLCIKRKQTIIVQKISKVWGPWQLLWMFLQFCVWGHGGGCSSSWRPSSGGASCCGSWSLLFAMLQTVGQLRSRSWHTSLWPPSAACSDHQQIRDSEAWLVPGLAVGYVPYATEWLRHRRRVSGRLRAAAAAWPRPRVHSKQHGAVASPHLEFGGMHKRRSPEERCTRRGDRRGWRSAAAQRQTGLEMFDEEILKLNSEKIL